MGDVTVIDVATKWYVDSALFLTLAVGFLVWGLASGPGSRAVVGFAIAAAGTVLVDRIAPTFPDVGEMGDGCEELPPYAPRRSAAVYALADAGWIALAAAVPAGFTIWWGGAALVGGLFAGAGIARLIAVRRLHRLEQARHIRLSVGLGRRQRRKRTFHARPDLGI